VKDIFFGTSSAVSQKQASSQKSSYWSDEMEHFHPEFVTQADNNEGWTDVVWSGKKQKSKMAVREIHKPDDSAPANVPKVCDSLHFIWKLY